MIYKIMITPDAHMTGLISLIRPSGTLRMIYERIPSMIPLA